MLHDSLREKLQAFSQIQIDYHGEMWNLSVLTDRAIHKNKQMWNRLPRHSFIVHLNHFFITVGQVACYHGNLAWLDELAFVRGDGSKYMLECLTRDAFMSCIRHACVFLEKESCSALLLCQWSVRRPQCFLADAQTLYINEYINNN